MRPTDKQIHELWEEMIIPLGRLLGLGLGLVLGFGLPIMLLAWLAEILFRG